MHIVYTEIYVHEVNTCVAICMKGCGISSDVLCYDGALGA